MRYELRPYQKRAVENTRGLLESGKRSPLIVSPTGCHARGQGIMLSNGRIKPVEKIDFSDSLMGPDGRPRKVLELIASVGDLFKIVPVKGEPFVVNGDHVLSLKRTNDGSNHAGKIANISVREFLLRSKSFKHVHKLYRASVDFPEIEAPTLSPYFVGVLLGDGCMCNGHLSITSPDPEIHAAVRAEAERLGCDIRHSKPDNRCESLHIKTDRGKENPLRNIISSMGLAEKRSDKKFIPDELKYGSRSTRFQVLAGLIDTDGHLSGNTYDFISKSERLSGDLVFVARSLGLAAYVSPCTKSAHKDHQDTYFRVCVSGDTSIIPCRVARKKAAPRRQKKDALVTGFSIEPAGRGAFYGFLLDKDHLYLLDDFTVTHNSGKTVIASHIIEQAQKKGTRTLFLAHRKELIEQASKKLDEIGISHGIIKAGNPRWAPHLPVQVASVQTIVRRFNKLDEVASRLGIDPAELFRLRIDDEAHHATANTHQKVKAKYPRAANIGLTATPYRSDGAGLGDIFDSHVEVTSIAKLIEDGFLVPTKVFAGAPPKLERVHKTAGDYNIKELSAAMNKSKLRGDIVSSWFKYADGLTTVCFAVDIAHSKAIVELFKGAGVAAEHLDGAMKDEDREGILERLASGETTLVSNVGVLTEGWDLPRAACCIIARPTKSLGLYIQMGGRILRPHRGKEYAIILDHAGVTFEHGFVTDERIISLDKGISPKRGASKYKCRKCRAEMRGRCRYCPQCGEDLHKVEPVELKVENVEMQEVTEAQIRRMSNEYRYLCRTAKSKGYKAGWVWHLYKARHGTLPGASIRGPDDPIKVNFETGKVEWKNARR